MAHPIEMAPAAAAIPITIAAGIALSATIEDSDAKQERVFKNRILHPHTLETALFINDFIYNSSLGFCLFMTWFTDFSIE